MLTMTVYLRYGAKGLVGASGDHADHECVPEVWAKGLVGESGVLTMAVYLRYGAKGGDHADHDCVPEVPGKKSCWREC
jgi:hypothetical protein